MKSQLQFDILSVRNVTVQRQRKYHPGIQRGKVTEEEVWNDLKRLMKVVTRVDDIISRTFRILGLCTR